MRDCNRNIRSRRSFMTLPSDVADEYWQSEQRDLYSAQSYLFLYFLAIAGSARFLSPWKCFYWRSREINNNDSIFFMGAEKLISKNQFFTFWIRIFIDNNGGNLFFSLPLHQSQSRFHGGGLRNAIRCNEEAWKLFPLNSSLPVEIFHQLTRRSIVNSWMKTTCWFNLEPANPSSGVTKRKMRFQPERKQKFSSALHQWTLSDGKGRKVSVSIKVAAR